MYRCTSNNPLINGGLLKKFQYFLLLFSQQLRGLSYQQQQDRPLCLFCEEGRVSRLLCEKDMVLRTKVRGAVMTSKQCLGLASWIRIRKNMRIRIKTLGRNINQKKQRTVFCLQIWTVEKKRLSKNHYLWKFDKVLA